MVYTGVCALVLGVDDGDSSGNNESKNSVFTWIISSARNARNATKKRSDILTRWMDALLY